MTFDLTTIIIMHLLVDAAISLKPNLHSASASPVRHLGVAAPASRVDVHVVILVCASNKSCKIQND